MSDLVSQIKSIQRAVGAEVDGVFGPRTAAAVIREIEGKTQDAREKELDARTLRAIETLDPKARQRFVDFTLLAKATAATFGCDYIAICGSRTWDEQAALRKKHLAGGPVAAAPGYSWHNYGTALDYGVFQAGGKTYCDAANPALAKRVHAACAVHAESCGLEWGGTWMGKNCDPPHYQIDMGRSSPTAEDRVSYKQKGSVL